MKTLNNLSIPIIQGGMGVGISLGGLAGAVAACGGMGVISTANIGFREDDFWTNTQEANRRALTKEIKKAQKIANGKGLIGINAMVATTNFADMVKTACEAGIDAIIAGAGIPLELPEIVKDFKVMIAPIMSSGRGAKTICKLWKKRYDRSPDFIVVEGSDAGGHLGFSQDELEEQTTQPLEQILTDVIAGVDDVPVFCGGGVFDKADIEKCLSLGARGVQIGTRFIATEECDASQGYKDAIIAAKGEDVTILKSPVGMPGRGLKTPLIAKAKSGERFPAQICIGCIHSCNPQTTPYCINRALIDAFYGKNETGLFFCGSNVGRINKMTTVEELIEELK